MGQEYEAAQQVSQIIQKKQEVLEKLITALKMQVECFQDETLDEARYERIDTKKDEYIASINQLNQTFDSIYPEAKQQLEQMIQKNDPMAEEIHTESMCLNQLSVRLQTEEAEVKKQLQHYLANERKAIKGKRIQKKTAATYYKTMTKQMDMMSYFYDQKK